MSGPNANKVFQKGFKLPKQNQDVQPIDDITTDGKPYKAAGKLEGKTALITDGDSGIGRAVAILFGEPLFST